MHFPTKLDDDLREHLDESGVEWRLLDEGKRATSWRWRGAPSGPAFQERRPRLRQGDQGGS